VTEHVERRVFFIVSFPTAHSQKYVLASACLIVQVYPHPVFETTADVTVDGKVVHGLGDTPSQPEDYDRLRPLSYLLDPLLFLFVLLSTDSLENVQEKV
jgi:hypothetical protein